MTWMVTKMLLNSLLFYVVAVACEPGMMCEARDVFIDDAIPLFDTKEDCENLRQQLAEKYDVAHGGSFVCVPDQANDPAGGSKEGADLLTRATSASDGSAA